MFRFIGRALLLVVLYSLSILFLPVQLVLAALPEIEALFRRWRPATFPVAVACLGILLFPAALAFAAEAVVSGPVVTASAVTVPYGDTINQVLEAVRNGVLAIVLACAGYAGRQLPGMGAEMIKTAIANKWLDRAVAFGFNTTEGALAGKMVTVQVGSVVAANALSYLTMHGPKWLIAWLGGHAGDIQDRIIARIPTEEGASLAKTVGGTVADLVVQPKTTGTAG